MKRRSPMARNARRRDSNRHWPRGGLERRRAELSEAFTRPRNEEAMKSSKVRSRGETTIPKSIREAAGIYAGDTLAFETDGEQVVIRKVLQGPDEHAPEVSGTMSEWASAEDEEAWRDL